MDKTNTPPPGTFEETMSSAIWQTVVSSNSVNVHSHSEVMFKIHRSGVVLGIVFVWLILIWLDSRSRRG